MRTPTYRTFGVSLALAVAAAAPAAAQQDETFTVKRTEQAAQLSWSPVHAETVTSPFDDDAGSLTDGASYFYLVQAPTGETLGLSVQKNFALDAVRLAFDAVASSCGVDGSLESCSALEALALLIAELQAASAAESDRLVIHELDKTVGQLEGARAALLEAPADIDEALLFLDKAIRDLNHGVQAGLDAGYAATKTEQLLWLAGQI